MVRLRSANAIAVDCPICIDPTKFAIETNCGHLYCGNCILQVWHLSRSSSPIVCPYCRQDVTLMLSCYTEDEQNVADLNEAEERERVTSKINEYNRMYSQHPRSLWGQILDLPTILRHVWADMFTWRGLEYFYKFRIMVCFICAFLYAVMPFDLIPEAVLGILGFIDDIFVVLFLLIQVGTIYRRFVGGI